MEDFTLSTLLAAITSSDEPAAFLKSCQDFHRLAMKTQPLKTNSINIQTCFSKIMDALLRKLNKLKNPSIEIRNEINATIIICQKNGLLANDMEEPLMLSMQKLKASTEKDNKGLDDYFKQIQRHPNSTKVGLSLCDAMGNLIMADDFFCKLMEVKLQEIDNLNFFNKMTPISRQIMLNLGTLLKEGEENRVFSFSIFSRKTFLNYLYNLKASTTNNKDHRNNRLMLKFASEEKNSNYFKFLKGLTVKVSRAKMKFDKVLLDEVCHKMPQMKVISGLPNKSEERVVDEMIMISAVLLQVRRSRHLQPLDYRELNNEPFIKECQRKLDEIIEGMQLQSQETKRKREF